MSSETSIFCTALHLQERLLLAEGVSSWQKNYYMPGTSDTGVAAWRSWLSKYGAAMPVLPRTLEDLPPLMDRRETLDRYHQHTKHCPDCMKVGIGVGHKLVLL